jgi:hypothetical protein
MSAFASSPCPRATTASQAREADSCSGFCAQRVNPLRRPVAICCLLYSKSQTPHLETSLLGAIAPSLLRWSRRSGIPALARRRRPRGATPVRLPDLGRGRPSIRCHIHVANSAGIPLHRQHHPLKTSPSQTGLLARQRGAGFRRLTQVHQSRQRKAAVTPGALLLTIYRVLVCLVMSVARFLFGRLFGPCSLRPDQKCVRLTQGTSQ